MKERKLTGINAYIDWIEDNPLASLNDAQEEWIRIYSEINPDYPRKLHEISFRKDGVFIFKYVRAWSDTQYQVKSVV